MSKATDEVEKKGSGLSTTVVSAITKAERSFLKIAEKDGLLHYEREAMFAIAAIRESKQLQASDPNSLRDSIVNVAAVGLSLNPAKKHACLIPRYDRAKKKYICGLDVMYQGFIKLAVDGARVTSCRADVWYENDPVFEYESGNFPKITHQPLLYGDRGEFRGAYVVAYVKDQEQPLVTFMRADEIYLARDASESYLDRETGKPRPSSPWVKWFDEMAKKTVIKRAQKTWPKSDDDRLGLAARLSDESHGFNDAPFDPTEPGDSVLLINAEQKAELEKMIDAAHINPSRIFKAFNITKLDDLPADSFAECRARLQQSVDAYVAKQEQSNGGK